MRDAPTLENAPQTMFFVLGALFGSSSTERCRPNPYYDPNNYTDPRAAQREICERSSSGSSSTRSGSWGGYSSGGSHK